MIQYTNAAVDGARCNCTGCGFVINYPYDKHYDKSYQQVAKYHLVTLSSPGGLPFVVGSRDLNVFFYPGVRDSLTIQLVRACD